MGLSAQEFLDAERVDADASLAGAELLKVFWRVRGLQRELARQQRFWESTNATLKSAFDELRAARDALGESRRRVAELLDHMRQAIVAFGPDGTVEGHYSSHAARAFGPGEIAGRSVRELLFPAAPAHDVHAQAFDTWLEAAFAVPEAAWREVAELAPREVTLRGADGRTRVYDLEFCAIFRDGRCDRVMLLATDATEQRRLEQTVQSQEAALVRQAATLQRLVAGGGQVFVRFLDEANRRLDACEQIVGASSAGALTLADAQELFFHVHTLKGEARAFDMGELEAVTAAMEEHVGELATAARATGRVAVGAGVAQELRDGVAAARRALVEGRELFVATSPIGRAALDQVTVDRADLVQLCALLAGRDDELGRLGARLAARPFGESIAGLRDKVSLWAAGESKQAVLVTEGVEVPVPAALARVLPGALAHLVRNAVAHGIERASTREGRGKPAVGRVTVRCSAHADGPRVVVEDDGGGLDQQALLDRAAALGLATTDAVDAAFAPEVSTRASADALAGRGVGLSAARHSLEQVGYALTASSRPGLGARFELAPRAGDGHGG